MLLLLIPVRLLFFTTLLFSNVKSASAVEGKETSTAKESPSSDDSHKILKRAKRSATKEASSLLADQKQSCGSSWDKTKYNIPSGCKMFDLCDAIMTDCCDEPMDEAPNIFDNFSE